MDKMAYAVDIQSLVYFKSIKETLISFHHMDEKTIDICSGKILQLSGENKKTVALFCLHSSPETNTGRNSHWFNHRLINSILNEDWNQLSTLISSDERIMFPEVYNSRRLNETEKKAILDMRDMELLSMENAFTEAMQEDCISKNIITGCSYYALCFLNMCKCRKLYFINWYLQEHILIPEYTKSSDGKTVILKNVHKVRRERIIKALSEGNVNPLNGNRPFPESIYRDLMNKVSKEVKMLQDFKESMSVCV